ncbi:MAG: rRNA maturation RNase YbeY [Gammaproteobacteria bacterium]|nr:rRNA maturation RNase YbeY [Gammaproteobacteria bacterium]
MAVDLQLANAGRSEVPPLDLIETWVQSTFAAIGRHPQDVTVRVTDEDEMTGLNLRFRGMNRPTNVLAFPFECVEGVGYSHLGDIVICYPVVIDESNQQDKPVALHFAHMVIHGTLHLCGLDHETEETAAIMEAVEQRLLNDIRVC